VAIRVRVPLTAFRGVAARAVPAAEGDAIVLTLEHADAALSIDLFAAADDAEILAQWRLWGRVLGLPLLAVDQAGLIRSAERGPAPRRRRSKAITARRPKLPLRRKAGQAVDEAAVYSEREIIARN
jgi:hypothetical protein